MRRRRLADSDAANFGFCPAKSQHYRVVVKPQEVLLLADAAREANRRSRLKRVEPISLRTPLALLLISLGAIAAVWWWLATPITLARAPIDPNAKLLCVSYTPFRGTQTPLDPETRASAEQIEEDLIQLAKISAAIRLTKENPGVITSLVVGNEVLLRGEMTTNDLAAIIRSVKAQVTVPVTYADVWEYWKKNREIYDAVDFITIHILPYWEDFPIRARYAAAHVDSIRKRMAVAFPNKEILIGETGWPSMGRMREGALPSRTNQARVVSEILDLAKRENFRVNLIEAFDASWKRYWEGTVGGNWGLFAADHRTLKYPPGVSVSNYPQWKLLMGSGLALAILVFTSAWFSQRRK